MATTLARLAALAALGVACQRQAPRPTAVGQAAAGQAVAPGPYLVSRISALRLLPSAAEVVAHPGRASETCPNVLGVLKRGQHVELRATQSGWAEVQLPDGARGWLPASDLLAVGAGAAVEATVLAATPFYGAADGAVAAGMVAAGTQIFVVSRDSPRSLVRLPQQDLAFVSTPQLCAEPREVGISQLLAKAASVPARKIPKVVAEGQRRYPDAALLPVLVARLESARGAPAR